MAIVFRVVNSLHVLKFPTHITCVYDILQVTVVLFYRMNCVRTPVVSAKDPFSPENLLFSPLVFLPAIDVSRFTRFPFRRHSRIEIFRLNTILFKTKCLIIINKRYTTLRKPFVINCFRVSI